MSADFTVINKGHYFIFEAVSPKAKVFAHQAFPPYAAVPRPWNIDWAAGIGVVDLLIDAHLTVEWVEK